MGFTINNRKKMPNDYLINNSHSAINKRLNSYAPNDYLINNSHSAINNPSYSFQGLSDRIKQSESRMDSDSGDYSVGSVAMPIMPNSPQMPSNEYIANSMSMQNTPTIPPQDTVTQPINSDTGNANAGTIEDAYNKALEDMITGKSYDSIQSGRQEALANYEKQNRASVADRVNRLGFNGQGIGEQIVSGTDDELARNRFSTINNMDIARNDLVQKGLSEYRATDLNNRSNELSRLTNEGLKDALRGSHSSSFANYVQSHPDLKNMSDSELSNDTMFMSEAQRMWESNGGQGQVPISVARNQMNAVNDPTLNDPLTSQYAQIDSWVDNGIIGEEDAQQLKDIAIGDIMGFGMIKRDKDGNWIVNNNDFGIDKNNDDRPLQNYGADLTEVPGDILSTLQNGYESLTNSDKVTIQNVLKNNPEALSGKVIDAKDVPVLNEELTSYTGKNRWRLTDDAIEYYDENKGKPFMINNKLYYLTGATTTGSSVGRGDVGYLEFTDLNGNKVKLNNAQHKNASDSKKYSIKDIK